MNRKTILDLNIVLKFKDLEILEEWVGMSIEIGKHDGTQSSFLKRNYELGLTAIE